MVRPKMRATTSLTDLDKIRVREPLVTFVKRNPSEKCCDKETRDSRFFDSSGYRVCCRLFHVKIATYVFCTLVLQEIVGGLIFLITHDTVRGGNINCRIIVLIICRLLQLPSLGLLYVGLYQCKQFYLLPFAFTQVTIGSFVDISSFIMILEQAERSKFGLPFHTFEWLNVVLPLMAYTALVILLMFLLYRCFIYFKAWTAHNEKYHRESLPTSKRNDMSEFGASLSKYNTKVDTLTSTAI
uniref:Uncharacterized protein n=1 Tax=Panagrolaimus sp. JU765 TaxID=591449 RepID=A0AC34QHQ4_9BILA